jgi:hypothetical protein
VNEKEAACTVLENKNKQKIENKTSINDKRVKRKNSIYYLYVITTGVDVYY